MRPEFYFLAPEASVVADYESVKTSQGGSAVRALILLLALVVFGLISFQAGKAALAAHLARSSRPEGKLRAAELEPGNGEYWDRLGLFREYDFDNANLPLAIEYYKKAIERNPRSDLYWMQLASAYEMAGDMSHAREDYEHARQVYPISAEVAWNYGNFLLRQSQFDQGFAEIHRAVLTDPSLIPLAISRCWRSSPDVDKLLTAVLPRNVNAYFQAEDFLSGVHEASAALKVWKRLLSLREQLPLERVFPLMDELIQQDRAEDSKEVWHEATRAAGMTGADSAGQSLVWNGGFESDVVNGGLDWRELPLFGAGFAADTTTFRTGSRSLRVEFEGGSNLDFYHLQQYVPVEPNKRYHFRAYLRTDQITTESEIHFSIYDPHWPPDRRVRTNGLVGTQPWTALEADVATDAGTHFLVIQLRRIPSRLFDNKLSGTAWVDDVSLTPLGAGQGQVSP